MKLRLKNHKMLAILVTAIFFFSLFPGYGFATEPLGPFNQIVNPSNTPVDQLELDNTDGITGDNSQKDLEEDPVNPDDDTQEAPGDSQGTPDEAQGGTGDDPEGTQGDEPGINPEERSGEPAGEDEAAVMMLSTPAAPILTVKHILQAHDGQTFEIEEEIPDVNLGDVINGIDYSFKGLPEGVSFTESIPESLIIQEGNNQIILYYQELPWFEDEIPEEKSESPDYLSEDEMEPYFSDVWLDFSPQSSPSASPMKMAAPMNRAFSMNTVDSPALAPGEVKATKKADWHDYDNRIAKITIQVKGEPVPIGADVVLVVDNSGSMGQSKVRDCNGEIGSLQRTKTETSQNFWGTKETEREYYTGICTECGKTVEYTRERTRTRFTAFSSWSNWSDWSTPNTIHSIYRIDVAKQAAASFVGTVLGNGNPYGHRVALVPFSSSGYGNHLNGVGFQDSVADLSASINAMYAEGGTNYTAALTRAQQYINGRTDKSRPAYVVFVSDGAPGQSGNSPNDPNWNGINQANDLKAAGVTIYSVGIALPQSSAAALIALATVENGIPLYRNVQNIDDLSAVLNKIAGSIKNAGTAALLTDEINTQYFDLLTGKTGYPLPTGVSVEPGSIVKWNIGAITSELQEIVLYVKLKDEYANVGRLYNTNSDVYLTYIDTEGRNAQKTKDQIGDPEVEVEAVTYTVTWVNYDGSELEKDENVAYGTMPTYNGATPSKPSTAQYEYTFAGWDPEVSEVTGDITYKATFSEATRSYTVTWVNYDGSELEKDENVAYGTMPTYNGATPSKPSTAQYEYTFAGWDPEVSEVTGDITYKATFSEATRSYTVTWVNYDGSELEKDENVAYGTMPTYNGATPSKPSTAQYEYTFAGWDPEVSEVTGDITYKATFSEATRSYTVTWVNYDGSELEKDENVAYGTMPTYNGATPSKPSTAQYEYTFAGWDPEVSEVTGDITYKATFSEATRSYTVTWVNYDGSELEKDENVAYGTMPTYNGATPSKPSTAQYEYTFAGWDPEVSEVTGDITYKATFSEATRSYTVTWVNYDGSELEKDENVAYGTMPTYNGATPSKPSTAQYEYTFAGWDPEVSEVTGDITYKATFSEATRSYTVTWVNYDGSELEKDENVAYGTMPTYNGATPSKPSTAQYEYTFAGWDPEVSEVTGDITYKATFSEATRSYTVTWVNYDGSELEKDENVAYGTMPTYNGATPSKPSTAQYEYTFAGWDPEVSEVTGDITYKATFSEATRSYTVTWVNYDGSELEKDENVAYGTMPTYNGATPSKPSTAQYEYTFAGWDPEVSEVTGDITYKATFSETTRTYTVTFVDWDGTILDSQNVYYGDAATAPADPTRTGHKFIGWDVPFNYVTGDLTVTAQYAPVFNVIYHANGGDDNPSDDTNYLAGEWVDVISGINREGYAFAGWNTKADGSGEHYMPPYGGFEMPAHNVDLYAMWAQAVDDEYSTPKNTLLTVPASGVLSNDTYVASEYFRVDYLTYPQHGDLNFGSDGSFTYQPYDGFVGTDSFFYQIGLEVAVKAVALSVEGDYGDNGDNELWFDPDDPLIAKVTITVYGNAPVAVNDSYSTNRNTTLTVAAPGILANDTDAEGDSLTAILVDGPSNGTLTLNADGSFTYVPNTGYEGTDTFTYKANDGIDDSKVATVTINVRRSGGGGGGGGGSTEQEIVVEPEATLVPLNKEDHFAYIAGYPDNTVRPEGKVTREEVAAVFYRLLDETYRESVKTDVNNFADVEAGRWSNIQISTLASIGVITGYPDGTFRPGSSITRAELATIASKFDELSPFEANNFSDIAGHWANQYINSAAQKGWVNGYEDGTFKPEQAITRAEFVTLVNNVLGRKVLEENILPEAKTFPDLSSNAWYYEAMMEAINGHYYERENPDDYEVWTELYESNIDL